MKKNSFLNLLTGIFLVILIFILTLEDNELTNFYLKIKNGNVIGSDKFQLADGYLIIKKISDSEYNLVDTNSNRAFTADLNQQAIMKKLSEKKALVSLGGKTGCKIYSLIKEGGASKINLIYLESEGIVIGLEYDIYEAGQWEKYCDLIKK